MAEWTQLEWENDAMANDRLSVLARKMIAEAQRRRWQQLRGALAAANRRPRDPQARVGKPPRSPLWGRLVENLGRELQDDEAKFVRRVQARFADARIRMLTENDLGLLAGQASDGYWNALDLWREFFPRRFLFLAVRRLGIAPA
jgi:hypothetical protein